jgi:hypothetical protein
MFTSHYVGTLILNQRVTSFQNERRLVNPRNWKHFPSNFSPNLRHEGQDNSDKNVDDTQVQHLRAVVALLTLVFMLLIAFACLNAAFNVDEAIRETRNRHLCSTLRDITSLPTDLVHIIVLFELEDLMCHHSTNSTQSLCFTDR